MTFYNPSSGHAMRYDGFVKAPHPTRYRTFSSDPSFLIILLHYC